MEDHRPLTTAEEFLVNCQSGWKPVGVFYQGSRVGDAAPACYQMIFQRDGHLIYDRSHCAGPDTSPLAGGSWSINANSLDLSVRPGNIYGPPTGGHIEELTATSLKFSFRGDPDKITEVWACP
ncbi:hypothetical protein ACFPMF_24255 [Larkinella bovis]|uniref:Lipocalin-like domain-containing protein n=1 Tax=Larkinella bovis TaxID=683041 RepID=A0ABW0IHX1_9BACT